MTVRNVRPFVHLRVLSCYSLGLGLSTPSEICRHARRVGFDTVALTDVSGTHGFIELHRAARETGVKPIYGTLLFLDWSNPPRAGDPAQWVLLLAIDRAGLRNVCAAATLSAVRRERSAGVYLADLEGLATGTVAIVGIAPTPDGPSPQAMLAPFKDVFHEHLYIERRAGLGTDAGPEENATGARDGNATGARDGTSAGVRENADEARDGSAAGVRENAAAVQERVLAEARALGIPPVLVEDVRFVGPSKPQIADLLASADDRAFEHRVFGDARAGGAEGEHSMATATEMSRWYEDDPAAYTNAASIAALVQPDLLTLLDEEPRREGTLIADGPPAMDLLRARLAAAAERTAPPLPAPPQEAARGLSSRHPVGTGADGGPVSMPPAPANTEPPTSTEPPANTEPPTNAASAAPTGVVERELQAIADEGLADAIVLFERIVRTVREARINLGPATGLTFQSAVAYRLGITQFDPHALTPGFEPDFASASGDNAVLELQVTPDDRPRLLALLNRSFDDASIGYVPSVEHVTAARALRIAGKKLGAPTGEVEDAARVATRQSGASLRELAEENRVFAALYRKSVAFREVVSHAASIEGLPYGFARTKRSLVVSPWPLRDFLGQTVNAQSNEHFVQSTRESFPCGVVRRVDVSTLHALHVLEGRPKTPLDDAAAYARVAADDLDGIPILDGSQRRLARAFGIESFPDLVAFLALLRHRGSDMSLGDRVVAFRGDTHPVPAAARVGEVLADTHGWLLFNDQARGVVARLTGLDGPGAARLTRRFLDPSPGNLATLRRDFLKLTVEQSVSFEDASRWFTLLGREVPRALDRQHVLADAQIVLGCLAFKAADPRTYMTRVLEHTTDDERRRRYQDSITRMPDTDVQVVEEKSDCARADSGIMLQGIDALVRAGAIVASTGREPVQGSETVGENRPEASPAQLGISFHEPPKTVLPAEHPYPPASESSIKNVGNTRHGFRVIHSLLEFYPHPIATPVELAGRLRNLHKFKASSGKSIGFFELFDSSGSVRVFVPWERVAQHGEPLSDGSYVTVLGKVRMRDGRKVCDVLEVVMTEGGNGHGETSPDDPSEGDP